MLNTFSKNIKYIKGKSQSHVERVGEECGLFDVSVHLQIHLI